MSNLLAERAEVGYGKRPVPFPARLTAVALLACGASACGRLSYDGSAPRDAEPSPFDAGPPTECASATFSMTLSSETLDVATWDGAAVALLLESGKPRLQVLSSTGLRGPPILLGDYDFVNVELFGPWKLKVRGVSAHVCLGNVLLDGFDAVILYGADLESGSTFEERLCHAGAHCHGGCGVTGGPAPLYAGVGREITSNPSVFDTVFNTHDEALNVSASQLLPPLGTVHALEVLGANQVLLTADSSAPSSMFRLGLVTPAGYTTTYQAQLDSASLVRLGSTPALLRSAGGVVQLMQIADDGTVAASEWTVETNAPTALLPSLAVDAGGATWMTWLDGGTAYLGRLNAVGELSVVTTRDNVARAWVVPAAVGVELVVARAGALTVDRVCPPGQ